MYGNLVKQALSRAIHKLKGQDLERLRKYIAAMPAEEGFNPVFNRKDLSGWQGLVWNPVERNRLKRTNLTSEQSSERFLTVF